MLKPKNMYITTNSIHPELYSLIINNKISIPYCENPVQAGAPVTDVTDTHQVRELAQLLNITENMFCAPVRGDSMIDFNLKEGDLIFIERDTEVQDGDIVVAEINGGCTVKQYHYDAELGEYQFIPGNKNFTPITVKDPTKFYIVGTVKGIFHTY